MSLGTPVTARPPASLERFAAAVGVGTAADAHAIRRALFWVPLWGLVVLLLVTATPAPFRGIALLVAVLAIVVRFAQQDPLFVVALLTLALAMSEDQPNTIKDFFARETYGSVWAASVFGSVTASDLFAVVAVLLSLVSLLRSPRACRVSQLDIIVCLFGVLLAYGAARGAVLRLPVEDWRFWFFDLRAALYVAGGYVVGRTLLLSSRPMFLVRLVCLTFAVVFLITTIQFSIVPTGFQAIGGGNIIVVSEIALLAAAYVLLGGTLNASSAREAIWFWALGAGLVTVVDFIAGRRTGLLLIAIALVVLLFITGRSRWRVAGLYAISVIFCLGAVALLQPKTLGASAAAVVVTVETAPEAVAAAAVATAPTSTAPAASTLPTLAPIAARDPDQAAAMTGTETRVGEVRNVIDSLRARSALLTGLGFGRLWQVLTPQADDYFAVGPRSGLYGTNYRFNLHVPVLDYLLRFGILGTVLLGLVFAAGIVVIARWPRNGHEPAIAAAAVVAAGLMLLYWGNPRTSFVVGLLLAIARVVEPHACTHTLREWPTRIVARMPGMSTARRLTRGIH